MNQKQAKELVRSRLSDKRYEHTLNVKKMAVKLAKRHGVDENRAALAALLHDAAKEISKDEMRALMRQYPQYAEGGEARPTPVWHGICAAILAQLDRGVTILHGEGGYSRNSEQVLLSVISNRQLPKLEKIAHLIDPTCFMIVSHVTEVSGRGFSLEKDYKEED